MSIRLANCIEKKINWIIDLCYEIADEDKCYMQVEMAKSSMDASDELVKILESNLSKYNDKYFEKMKLMLLRCAKENLTLEEIYDKYANIPRCMLEFLLYDQRNLSQEKEEEDKEFEDNIEDKHEEIEDSLLKNIKNFNWRLNQTKAIENTIKQGYKSGIHHQIMGSGKTYIMLNLINKHYAKYEKNKMYIICCDKQEVLKKIFFDGTILDKEKIKFWKNNEIIDLNQFNFIDCINYKPKEIEINRKIPSILLINNDYLSSLDKKNNIEWEITSVRLKIYKYV